MNALKIAPLVLSADFSRLKEEVIVSGSGILRRSTSSDHSSNGHSCRITVEACCFLVFVC
jgi:hypothetical protein